MYQNVDCALVAVAAGRDVTAKTTLSLTQKKKLMHTVVISADQYGISYPFAEAVPDPRPEKRSSLPRFHPYPDFQPYKHTVNLAGSGFACHRQGGFRKPRRHTSDQSNHGIHP